MQVLTSVGNVYEVVAVLEYNMDYAIYRVADTSTRQSVGYVGGCWIGDRFMCGPLANSPENAKYLAHQCAYNRAIIEQKRIAELVRSL